MPPLLDIFPEARLNLVIYHLKNDDILEAFNLVKDLEPTVPREYIIKAVVHSVMGQSTESREHLKVAQQLFQLVGSSASECDTIPGKKNNKILLKLKNNIYFNILINKGRQCMAACFFLLKQFDDVLVYLNSIKNFFQTEDDFLWNYGIALASTGDYKGSEEAFIAVQSEKYRNDECYIRWLTRVYIMNGKPK